jgi:hypothetical protein
MFFSFAFMARAVSQAIVRKSWPAGVDCSVGDGYLLVVVLSEVLRRIYETERSIFEGKNAE